MKLKLRQLILLFVWTSVLLVVLNLVIPKQNDSLYDKSRSFECSSQPVNSAINFTSLSPMFVSTEDTVNPHIFQPLLLPNTKCSHGLDLFIFIHSAPVHFEHRIFIRNTWGNNKYYPHLKIDLIFLMGSTTDDKLQSMLQHESQTYKDILQEDFIDSYRNMTHKYIAGLKFISENCKDVPYILKTDDDVLINMFSLFKIISGLKRLPCNGLILCHPEYKPHVFREKDDKWYVSKSDYAADFYPDYCSGVMVLMSSDVIQPLYKASLHIKYFWIDDVFVTGMAREIIQVKLQKIQEELYNLESYENVYQKSFEEEEKYVFCHSKEFDKMKNLWGKFVQYYKLM